MAATQTGTPGTKDNGTGATHDLSYAMPADADFCRVSVSFTSITVSVNSVTWDQGGTNQAMSRPSGMSAVLENSDGHRLDEYVLVAPVTGTKTLRVVLSGTHDGTVIGITAYKGVDQSTPVSGFQSFTTPGPGDTASPTDLSAVSSDTGNLVVESLGIRFGDLAGFTVDGSQTVEVSEADDLFGGGALKSSNKAGASSVTMQYTFSGTKHYCMLGYNIKAAATEPPTDKAIWELAALTTAALADILAIVDDPSGTPITKKLALTDLRTLTCSDVVVQVKTVGSGTYTPTAGMRQVLAIGVGGGGGGDGGINTDSAGGGGGGAGTCIRLLSASDIGASKAYVVGAGGSAGNAGTATTIDSGTLLNAGGGGAGAAGTTSTTAGTRTAGGTGGSASNGDINIPGMPGGIGVIFDTTNGNGGNGGSSALGFGALSPAANTAGSSGQAYGGGGSGGHASSTANRVGGAGADGILYLIEFI